MPITPDVLLRAASKVRDAAVVFAEKDADLAEGLRRMAVHAAYYACFLDAEKWAIERGYPESFRDLDLTDALGGYVKATRHETLWSFWYRADPLTSGSPSIAEEGLSLKYSRVNADYKPGHTLEEASCSASIKQAETIFALLEADRVRVRSLPPAEMIRTIPWTEQSAFHDVVPAVASS